MNERARLRQYWPTEQIIQITPAVFAYATSPTDGATPASDTAYWVPPGAVQIVSGQDALAREIASRLTAGGLKAKPVPLHKYTGNIQAATIEPFISGLELAGWSWPRFTQDMRIAAAREACVITSAAHDIKPPKRIITSPAIVRLLWRIIGRLAILLITCKSSMIS